MIAVINTEIQSRELSANLLLALSFAELGGTSLILDQSTLPEVLPSLPPNGIFHAKSLESSKIRAIQHEHLISKGYSITAQDQEHGLLVKDYDLTVRQRFSLETISRVTRYFCWGPLDSEVLRNKFPEFQHKIIQTGSPRIDLAREGVQIDPEVDADQKELLFVSSIESHSPSRYWEILRNMKKLSETDRAPELVNQRFNYWADEIRAIPDILRLFSMLASKFPTIPMVVRPHFSEDPAAWEFLTEDYPSIRVESKVGVNDAISRSLAILHYGSTVAIESLLADVPPIALPLFGSSENTLTPFSNLASLRPKSLEDVVEEVRKIRSGIAPKLGNQRALLASRFRIEGAPASSLIASEWKSISQHKTDSQFSDQEVRAVRKALKRSEKRITTRASSSINSGIQRSAQQKFPPLSPNQVQELMVSLTSNQKVRPANFLLLSPRAVLVFP